MPEQDPRSITRAKGGTEERRVPLDAVEVPDLWHLAMWLGDRGQKHHSALVLECWHLCHDLLRELRERTA